MKRPKPREIWKLRLEHETPYFARTLLRSSRRYRLLSIIDNTPQWNETPKTFLRSGRPPQDSCIIHRLTACPGLKSTTPSVMAAEEPETPWNDAAAAKFEGKQFSQYFDPCQEAAARSLRCLHRNGGDREMCSDFFQAYRDCKKQWTTERKEEKRKKGISLW